MAKEDVRKIVREGYGKIAREGSSCGCMPGCCGGSDMAGKLSKRIGYSDEELSSVPEGANLGLGCGNPVALASLKEGETVLDLGAGAGFDALLAAKRVGSSGKVIGVDMTPEMVYQARENAQKGDYKNVEFRLGEIENLPVADSSIDVIISNCVINLSPDKAKVFGEAFRVLKLGGRLMVSDIVLLKELPDAILNSVQAYLGCVAGAIKKDDYLKVIESAGFKSVRIIDETLFPVDLLTSDPTVRQVVKSLKIPSKMVKDIAASAMSIKVSGVKPA
ncbi:MAG: arsenite methyltransferase [Chloroflexota bacterium]